MTEKQVFKKYNRANNNIKEFLILFNDSNKRKEVAEHFAILIITLVTNDKSDGLNMIENIRMNYTKFMDKQSNAENPNTEYL